MAKRTRARSRGTKNRQKTQKQLDRETQLYEGEFVAPLEPPNHLVPKAETRRRKPASAYLQWPLVLLHQLDEESDSKLPVFIDQRHNPDGSYQWQDHPPTWMDPHLFLSIAWKDKEVRDLCHRAFTQNDRRQWRALAKVLQRVFDEKYLPELLDRFDQQAAPLLAQWLIRRYAYEKTDPSGPPQP
jgi:hypothetical protein